LKWCPVCEWNSSLVWAADNGEPYLHLKICPGTVIDLVAVYEKASAIARLDTIEPDWLDLSDAGAEMKDRVRELRVALEAEA
jgi:hypothetical protein